MRRNFFLVLLFSIALSSSSPAAQKAGLCRRVLNHCKIVAASAVTAFAVGCGSTSASLTPQGQQERELRFTDSEQTIQDLDRQAGSESDAEDLTQALNTAVEDLLFLADAHLAGSPERVPDYARARHLLELASRLTTEEHYVTVRGSSYNTWSNMSEYWNVTNDGKVPMWPGDTGKDAEMNAWKVYCPVSWPFVLVINLGCIVGDASFHWTTSSDRRISVEVSAALKTRVTAAVAEVEAQRTRAPLPAFNATIQMSYRFSERDPETAEGLLSLTRSQEGFIPGTSRDVQGQTFQGLWGGLAEKVAAAGGRVGQITVVIQESAGAALNEADITIHAAVFLPVDKMMEFIAANQRFIEVSDEGAQAERDRRVVRVIPRSK